MHQFSATPSTSRHKQRTPLASVYIFISTSPPTKRNLGGACQARAPFFDPPPTKEKRPSPESSQPTTRTAPGRNLNALCHANAPNKHLPVDTSRDARLKSLA